MQALEASARPARRVLVAVGLVAGVTLAQQVLLTRLLSAAVYYHFSFLAVSLALLGSGSGAIFVYVKPDWFERIAPERVLARWSAAFAILLLACAPVLVRLDYSDPGLSGRFALNLLAACVISFLPFFAAGTVLALAIKLYAKSIGAVYASDLVGAGLGSFAVIPLLWLIPVPTLMIAISFLAALSSALFAPPRHFERKAATAVIGAAAGLSALSAVTSLAYLPPGFTLPPRAELTADRWTPISRVLGYAVPGDSAPFDLLFYDRVYAPVFRYRRGDPMPDWKSLHLGPQTIGYELTGPGSALIIGGGGGRDIFNALTSNQREVDVIELNGGVRRVVDDDMAAYSGSPYSLPGVSTAIGDGRSTLARRDKKYTQIHLSFTDTLSANSASAFALTEANLYTLEAFDEYLDHLAPYGVLNVTRLYRLADEEALRLTVLTLEALRRHGVSDPRRNVVVILGRDVLAEVFGTVLARLEPFTEPELQRIRALAAERGLGVAFEPDSPGLAEWQQLAKASSPMDFCTNYPMNVCPPTDDEPFFFNMRRLQNIGRGPMPDKIFSVDPMLILMLVLGILIVLSAFAYAVPLIAVRTIERPPAGALLFFIEIGLGYIVLEMALIQRFVLFLGFPTYALSVVLFALLTFSGIGSLLSATFARPKSALTIALAVTCALIVVSAATLQPLLRHLILLPFLLRVALSVALIAPFGIAMGMAMPIGLRRLGGLYPTGLPYAFGVNGIASVVGTVLAVAIAINFGFTVATLFSGACYLSALAHVALAAWPVELSGEIEPLPERVSAAASSS